MGGTCEVNESLDESKRPVGESLREQDANWLSRTKQGGFSQLGGERGWQK
jgi:hypothetical protein